MEQPSSDRRVRHGMFSHPLYKVWEGMLSRCEKPTDISYGRYGGRGISVCEQWHNPATFVRDIEREIGPRPAGTYPSGRPLYTLDRVDNDGGYEPGNVRWSTVSEQALNRRDDAVGKSARLKDQWSDRPVRTETCEQCGAQYQTRALARSEFLRFCSKACKARHRRATGADNVERTCHVCGSAFTCNKYDKTSHCGQSCAARCQHAGGCRPLR